MIIRPPIPTQARPSVLNLFVRRSSSASSVTTQERFCGSDQPTPKSWLSNLESYVDHFGSQADVFIGKVIHQTSVLVCVQKIVSHVDI